MVFIYADNPRIRGNRKVCICNIPYHKEAGLFYEERKWNIGLNSTEKVA